MSKSKQLLVLAAVVAALSLPIVCIAETTTVSGGTATVNTTEGTVVYDENTYSWSSNNDDILNLDGGSITVTANGRGYNGILNAISGTITLSNGSSNTNRTTLTLATESIIEAAVKVVIGRYSTINLTGGTLYLDSGDSFQSSSVVSMESGALYLDGVTSSSSSELRLSATGGTLNMEGGTTFTLTTNSSIAAEVIINTVSGTTINVTTGTLYLDNQDSISGGLSLTSNSGSININSVEDFTPESYTQSAGSLNLTESKFTAGTGSSITGGTINLENSTLNIASGGTATTTVYADEGDTVNITSDSTLNLSGGTIASDAQLNVAAGSGINVNSSSAVINIDSDDIYSGSLSVSSGTANITDKYFNTDSSILFNLLGGTINLDNSEISLNNSSSVFNGGSVNMSNSSSLIFSNGETNKTSITTSGDDIITLTNNSNLQLSGGTIGKEAEITIESGSELSVSGAEVTLDSDTDNWSGALSLNSGTISLNDFNNDKSISTDSTNKTFNQSGGTLNLESTNMTLNEGSSITGGTVNLTDDSELYFSNGGENSATINANDSTSNIIQIINNSTLISDGGTIDEAAAITIDSGSTLNINGSTSDITIDSTDIWSGNIELSGGILNITGYEKKTTDTSTYTQTGGTLNLDKTILVLNTGDSSISGGYINLRNASILNFDNGFSNSANITTEDSSLNVLTVSDGSSLTLTGGTINKEASVTVADNASLTISGANVSLDGADTWGGDINLLSGELSIEAHIKASGFSQTGGSLTLDNSNIELTQSTDILKGGNISLTNNSTLVIENGEDNTTASITTDESSTLQIKDGTSYDIQGGKIIEGTVVTIESGSGLSVSGADVTLDSGTDDWSGALSLNSGTISLNDFNNDKSISTDSTNKTFNQSGGTLNLESTNMTLNEGSSITGGTVNLTDDSELYFSNGGENSATINANDSTSNIIQIINNSTLISDGGTIDEAAAITIDSGSTLNINGSTSDITIDSTDIWSGNIELSGGILNITGYEKKTTDTSTYTQTGGTLNLDKTILVLNTGDSSISGGYINLRNASILNFDNGFSNSANITTEDSSLNVLTVSDGSSLTLTGGTINKEASVTVADNASLTISGANVFLDKDDDWSGNIDLTSGSLTLNEELVAETDANKTYTQTGGTLYVDNASLTLNTEDSYITGGTGYLQNSGELTIANGLDTNSMILYAIDESDSVLTITDNSTLTMTAGTIDANAQVDLDEGSKLKLDTGTVSVTINNNDTWEGSIEMANNTVSLTVSDNAESVGNGILEAKYGTLTVGENGRLYIIDNASIAEVVTTKIEDTGELHITGGTVYINRSDTWSGDIYLTDGTLNYTYLTTNGNIYADGGTLNVYRTNSSGTLNVYDGSYIYADTVVNLTNSATIAITDGYVYLNSGDTWDSNTTITLDGDGLLDYSDLTSGGRLQATSGNLNVHSGILNINNTSSYILEAVQLVLDQEATISISTTHTSNGVTINDGDNWNGNVELSGGILNITGYKKETSDTSTYTQTGGTLNLSDGADLVLNAGSSITDGTVTFGSSGEGSSLTIANGQEGNAAILSTSGSGDSFTVTNNSTFTHTSGTIYADDTVKIDEGSTINLEGTSNSSLSSLYLNEGDTWAGNIELNSNFARLYIDNISKKDTGTLVQSASSAITTITGSSFDLNNSSDHISAGTLNIGSSSSSNTGTLGVSAGVIDSGAVVNLISGSILNISGDGTVTIDDGDLWAGTINQTGGTLIFDELTSNGILNSSGGKLNLTESSLTLDGSSIVAAETIIDIDESSEITVSNGASLSLDKYDIWKGSIVNTGGIVNADSVDKTAGSYTQTDADSVLNVTGEGFELSDADSILDGYLNIGDDDATLANFTLSGGTIANDVTVKVFENAKLIINGGELTLSGEDNVAGTLTLNDGDLTLNDWSLSNAVYVQTGGNLYMYDSVLRLTDSDSSITDGSVYLYDKSLLEFSSGTNSTLKIITDDTENTIDINSGNITFNASSNINSASIVDLASEASLSIASGVVNLNDNDIWAGTINNSSVLNIDNVSKTGSLVQKVATAQTNVTGNFALNSDSDNITAGTLNIGSSSDNTGTLRVSAGVIDSGAVVNLISGSILNISGDGTVTIDDDDFWAGDVSIAGGTLNISTDDRTGVLTINGGVTNISSEFTVDGDDTLVNGIINLYDILNMENGAVIASDVALSISSAAAVNVDETSVLNIDDNDSWGGRIYNNGIVNLSLDKETSDSSLYVQIGGVLNISEASLTLKNGSSITDNGTVNLSNSSGISFDNGTLNSAVIRTLDDTSNSVIVKSGTSLTLSGETDINSEAYVELGGNVTISGGEIVLDEGDTLTGSLTNTGAEVTFGGLSKTGSYTQSGEKSLLNVIADLTLGNTDSITAGSLKISDANLTLNNISIDDDIIVILNDNGILTINFGSSVYLSSEDTVNGSIANSGSLTVKDITLGNSYSHNNAELIMDNSTFNAQTGTVSGGSIALNNNSELNISNGGYNNIAITTDVTNNKLSITDESTVVMESGTILENAIFNITSGSTFILAGNASLTLNDSGETADTWQGLIQMTSADSTLKLVDYKSSIGELIASAGNLILYGKTSISLSDGSIAEAVSLDIGVAATLYLSGADLTLDYADNWAGTIVMENESSSLTLTGITTDDNSNLIAEKGELILDSSTLNLTGTSQIASDVKVNIKSDSTLNITGGTVTLDGLTDKWEGTLTISDGNLTLDNMIKSEGAIYQQTGGTTTILGTSFDLNNEEDYVSGGTLIVGDGKTESLLTVSAGTIYDDATLVINDNAEVNITNNGASGENGSGSGRLEWAGHVQVDGGSLIIDSNDGKQETGKLTQTGGEIVVSGEFDLNNAEDVLEGGELTVSGSLKVSAGTIEADNNLEITETGEILVNGGSVTINGGDIWDGLVSMTDGKIFIDNYSAEDVYYSQSGGTFSLTNSSDLTLHGDDSSITGGYVSIDNSSLSFSSGSSINNTNVSLNNAGSLTIGGGKQNTVDFLSDDSANKVTITGNSDLTINSGDILKQTIVNIQEGSTLNIANSSSVTLDDLDTWAGIISLDSEDATLTLEDYTGEGTSGLYAEYGKVILGGSTILTLSDGTIAEAVKLTINTDATLNLSGTSSLILDKEDTWLGTIGMYSSDSSLTLTGMNITDEANLIATAGNLRLDNTVLTIGGNSNISNDVNLNIDSVSTVNLTDGELNIDDGDTWAGTVNNQGGNLTIDRDTTNKTGVLTQESKDAKTTVLGTFFDLNNVLDRIMAGELTVGNGMENALLTVSEGSIDSAVIVNITEYASISIKGGDVTLDDDDIWKGNLSISDDGELTLDGVNKDGILEQTGGNITIASEFTLNNASDSLNGGSLNLNDNAKFIISNGTVGADTSISMEEGSSIEVSGGELTLNDDDIWSEQVTVAGGILNIYDPQKTGSLVQTSGVTNILQDFTLNNVQDSIEGGTLSISDGVELTVSNGQITAAAVVKIASDAILSVSGGYVTLNANDTWNGSVVHTSGDLTVSGYDNNTNVNGAIESSGGNLTIKDGYLTIASGSSIASDTLLNINSEASLDITGGTVELDSSDIWNGNISISEGSLSLSDINKTTGTESSFIQTGGSLSMSDSTLTIADSESGITSGDVSLDNSNLTISGGSINGSDISLDNSSTLTISNGTSNSIAITTEEGTNNTVSVTGNDTKLDITGGTITEDTSVTIGSGATVNITGADANVILDGLTDKWEGTLTISDGYLTLDNMIKSEGAIYQQTGGTTTILGTSFDLNNEEDYVSGGTLIVGDGKTESLLTVSAGTIYDDATLVINDNAEVNITNNGASGENGSGSGRLEWAGHVQVDGGSLIIDSNDGKQETGKLTQTGGEIVVSGEFDLNNAEDVLEGGELTVSGSLKVSAGTIEADNNLEITETGEILVNGGSVTINGGDIWDGLVKVTDGDLILDGVDKSGILTQTGGNTVITGDFNLNNEDDLISGGELTIQEDTFTISQGTVGADADITINTDAKIAVTDNGSLTLDSDDIWNGDVSVSGGKLVISEIEDKTGSLTQTSGDISITGDFNLNNTSDLISEGSLTIQDGTFTISQGTVEAGADITINTDAEIAVTGGSLTLDTGDSWNGDISLSSGNLSIAQDKITTTDSTFNQTGGTLDLSSSLTLKEGSSITGDSIVNVTGGSLIFENNTQNSGSITTGDSSYLTVSADSSLELTGGTIADGSVLDISGDLSINGSETIVNVGSGDTWKGNITLVDGNLNLTVSKVTDADSTYNQTGGNLSISGVGLTLNDDSSVTGGSISLDGGTLTASSGSSITTAEISMNDSSSLVIDNGENNTVSISTDETTNSIYIATGSTVTVIGGEIAAETELGIYGDLNVNNDAIVTVDDTDIWEGKISLEDGTLILENVADAGDFEAKSGTLEILGSNTTLGENLVVNKGVKTIIDDMSTLKISGGSVTFDDNESSSDDWSGGITMSSGSFTLTDNFLHETEKGTYNQDGGTLYIDNGAGLTINDAMSSITGNSVVELGDNGTLTIANGRDHSGVIKTTGNSEFVLSSNSSFTMSGDSSIVASTDLSIANGSTLNVSSGEVVFDNLGTESQSDNWSGKVNVTDTGRLTIADSNTSIGTDGNITSANLEQTGGTLSLSNTVLELYENMNDILQSGTVEVDSRSRINLGTAWANSDIILQSAGLIAAANGAIEANSLGGLIIDNVNGRADFTIDIYENAIESTYTTDTFDFTSITSTDSSQVAIVNISGFNLIQSNSGAMITSQTVDLGNIFDADEIGDNVIFTSTAEDVLTPVNRYQLVASDANDGTYYLNILGYNKQAFRGQVVSVAQLMNQLVINDIMFDRLMLTPQTLAKTSVANRLAIQDTNVLPGYEYTRHDPGIWVKTYGNFETLRMTEGLAVENSAYGSLVGVDMGTIDIGKGWSWIPTVYMGYIGAHQSFSGVSANENGGQIGAMGTFFNKNWIASLLGYASLYNVEMNVQGNNDQDMNYYAGTALKGAYNWRIKNKFIVQPSATVSYNFFGGPKWQSNYGQIGMTTGTLNGLNVAPGVNFIWQEETWNIFATVAYVYNCVGGVSGSASGVELPDIWLKRGYLQYGFGISKELTDRLSLFAQVILRNVGRTGIGFQGELEYRF